MTLQFNPSDVLAQLEAAKHICVMSHVSPDGDAIGSLLGLTSALRASGNQVSPCIPDDVPKVFSFLPGSHDINNDVPANADLFVTLDCAGMDRLGKLAKQIPPQPHINIDHHISNTRYAHINLVDTRIASTSEYLVILLEKLGVQIDSVVATCLLTGIVTDTLGFRTPNTTPDTLATAQTLMELGAPLHEIYDRTMHQRSLSATRLWGHALSDVQSHDGLVWASLPLSAKAKVGYTASGDADVVTQLTAIETTDVAVVFVERINGEIKISWRSTTGMNVEPIARSFGGGGHQAASGANLYDTSLADAEREVLSRTRIAMRQFRQNGNKDAII